MSICPRCGASNDDDATFCDKCGSRMKAADVFEPVSYQYSTEDEGAQEEETYFEWDWIGLKYSYTREGYWLRIGFVLVLGVFISIMMILAGEGGYGICFLVLILLAVGASLLFLIFQRDRF